jgi:hypothetical protein
MIGVRERAEIGAGAAAEVGHRLARTDRELSEHAFFVRTAQAGRGDPVEMDERVGGCGLEHR